jgi:hypothetical protein
VRLVVLTARRILVLAFVVNTRSLFPTAAAAAGRLFIIIIIIIMMLAS